MTRMFSFITNKINPVGGGGKCPHGCLYCWSKRLINRFKMKKYQGPYRIIEKELKRTFKPGEFVFVCDMIDLFADPVPNSIIFKVLAYLTTQSRTRFLLLTKNPKRYYAFLPIIPENCVLGTTIETNLPTPSITKAPTPFDRFMWIHRLNRSLFRSRGLLNNDVMISIEPIMDFSEVFLSYIHKAHPSMVAVGYDNYNCHLPEPSLKKTRWLIENLNKFTKVYEKTLRKAWYE